MGRYRSRSRSRSYSPRRRSKRYDDPRDSRSHRDRRSPTPSGLLVRNISLDARTEDLRIPFERFGPLKDVYLPKDYYTGESRGFGFVKYRYPEDAADAKEHLNCTVIGGREIRVVFAEENRKTPQEMRRVSLIRCRERRARDDDYSPRRSRSVSRSVSPRYRSNQKSSRRSRSISRSLSPRDERNYRSPSPRENGQSPYDERDHLPSRSPSPRGYSRSPSKHRSRSYSPR